MGVGCPSPQFLKMKTRHELLNNLLVAYLEGLGMEGYTTKVSIDEDKTVLFVEIPKFNHERIAVLKGKNSKNLLLLKKILNIVGRNEGLKPLLVVKLTEEKPLQ